MTSFLAILTALISVFYQEPVSGIYIINNNSKRIKCENESRMIVGKEKVCLSPKPILLKQSIRRASEIKYDPKYQAHYIELDITTDASRTLVQMVKSLPQSKFAFALNGDVLFIFSIKEDVQVKSLLVGQDVALADLMRIQTILRSADL